MSRFYETLKQVSVAGGAKRESTSAASWFEAGLEELDNPQRPSGHAEPLPVRENWDGGAEALLAGFAGPQQDVVAMPTAVALDRKAGLLPNTLDPVVPEYYRRLRTKLLQLSETKPFRSVLVTSPAPNEGKTVTVMNLALSFAKLPSSKVLVIDGDIRRGRLGKWLGLPERAGLSNLIDGSARIGEVVLQCNEIPICFLPCGTSERPAGDLLQSDTCGQSFRRVAEHFDIVLVDSPPLNLVTDADLLAANCDAVLLVARAFSTRQKSLAKAAADLARYRVLGTVLNAAATERSGRGYGAYYYGAKRG